MNRRTITLNGKNKLQGFSNFGFSTIVFSFVMICVVSFSVLSLATANADYKLSQKAADKNEAYYLAEEQAYKHISYIETILYATYRTVDTPEAYYQALVESLDLPDGGTYTYENGLATYAFTIEISENQHLDIELEIKYPHAKTDTFIKILQWKSVYEQELPEDEYLDLLG